MLFRRHAWWVVLALGLVFVPLGALHLCHAYNVGDWAGFAKATVTVVGWPTLLYLLRGLTAD